MVHAEANIGQACESALVVLCFAAQNRQFESSKLVIVLNEFERLHLDFDARSGPLASHADRLEG